MTMLLRFTTGSDPEGVVIHVDPVAEMIREYGEAPLQARERITLDLLGLDDLTVEVID